MMKIEINPETGTASIDRDTIDRLTKGTPFQRSMNLIAMFDEILSATDAEYTKGMNRKQRRAWTKQARKHRRADLLKNPPPMADFDPAAVKAFYD